MVDFLRTENWREKSYCYNKFNNDQTLINKYYWSFQTIYKYGQYKVRRSEENDTTKFFKVDMKHPDARRVETNLKIWSKDLKCFENWSRLYSIVSVSSYFEVYIKNMIKLSILSDPSLYLGTRGIIDGTELLKRSIYLDVNSILDDCTKGDWNKRISQIKNHLGSVPPLVNHDISELERIRKVRNRASHEFGRVNYDALMFDENNDDIEIISEEKFKKWLGIIDKVALKLDDFFIKNYIGCFETILFLHYWRNKNRKFELTQKTGRALSKAVRVKFNQTPGIEYCADLTKFYDSFPK